MKLLTLTLFLALWIPKAHANFPEIPACIRLLLDQKIAPKDEFVEALKKAPVSVYKKIKDRALDAKAQGKETFPFPEAKPVLFQMMAKIEDAFHFGRIPALPGLKKHLEDLRKQGPELLAQGIPYHSYQRYALSFATAMDRLTRLEYPEYDSHYNEGLAKHLFEPLIRSAPDAILWPSFASVDELFFIRVRRVPVYLTQLDDTLGFADGYVVPPLEEKMHDVGHSDFKHKREVERDAPIDFDQRDRTSEALITEVDSWIIKDSALRRAEILILFEILHERGFTVDLEVLRPQLETPKWTDVIIRKLEKGYYKQLKTDPMVFSRLQEARTRLLALVKELSEKEAYQKLQSHLKSNKPVQIQFKPVLQSYYGKAKSVEILGSNKFEVLFDMGKGKPEITCPSLYDVSLAQVDPIKPSPFTKDFVDMIEQAMFDKELGLVDHIFVGVDGSLRIVRNPNPPRVLKVVKEPPKLVPLDLFKIEQLMHLNQTSKEANFSLMGKSSTFEGHVTHLSSQQVTLDDGSKYRTFPLSQIEFK